MKILLIAPHRLNRSPSQRFRFEQYFDFLKSKGIEFTYSPAIDESDDVILYTKGKYFQKLLIELKCWRKRLKDIKRAKQHDVVFIHREALMTFSTYFEKRIAKANPKVVYDFDDAIWLPEVSAGNKNLQSLKKPEKVNVSMSYARMVFAGNSYLAEHARQFCNNVKVIPTTINTDYHKAARTGKSNKVTIGWTGTQTTLKYLKSISSVFFALKEKYNDKIEFVIICDQKPDWFPVEFKYLKWQLSDEIQQLNNIDIGIMPLIDNQWTKGKCGFKGLQYMAMEAATVMSPVGVNKEIIQHGKNGYLAENEDQWLNYISALIDSEALRFEFGKNGRKTVIEKYSVDSQKHRYLQFLNELNES